MKNNLTKIIRTASKEGNYLGIIHKLDGTIEFVPLAQNEKLPERLVHATKSKDSQIYLRPEPKQISHIQGTKMQAVVYSEGFTQPITAEAARQCGLLFTAIKELGGKNELSEYVYLFDVIDIRKTAEEQLEFVNMEQNGVMGESLSVEQVQFLINLKSELMKSSTILSFEYVRGFVAYVHEAASINIQNLISRMRYIDQERAGRGVLGTLLASSNTTKIIFVAGLVGIILLSQLIRVT